MSKRAVRRPRRDNQIIIGNFEIGQLDDSVLEINLLHFAQQHFDVAVVAHDPADGCGNLARRKPGRSHLVK